MTDQINPNHYKRQGNGQKIETIEAILSQMSYPEAVGYLKGSAMKYLSRMGVKDGEPGSIAVGKAHWFLERLMKLMTDRYGEK